MSGAMYMTGTPGHPVKSAAPYVDYSTAVLSAFGTLAALMQRAQTGQGQEVKASLLGTALSVFGSHLVEQSATGIGPRAERQPRADLGAVGRLRHARRAHPDRTSSATGCSSAGRG